MLFTEGIIVVHGDRQTTPEYRLNSIYDGSKRWPTRGLIVEGS